MEEKELTPEQITEQKIQQEKGGRAHILDMVFRGVQAQHLKPEDVVKYCKEYITYIETGK